MGQGRGKQADTQEGALRGADERDQEVRETDQEVEDIRERALDNKVDKMESERKSEAGREQNLSAQLDAVK
jgi:hypothetical protein